MDIEDFLGSFNNRNKMDSDEKKAYLNQIESVYGSLTDDIVCILKIGDTAFSTYQGRKVRFLGLNEISNAEKFLHIPFSELKKIPLFDLGNNDFICYDLEKQVYSVFNIIDEIDFFSSASLISLLEKI
jgi:hypothetical protein